MLIVSLIACSAPNDPLLKLGTNIWPGYEPLYLAQEQQLIKPEDIRLIEFSSATQTLQAFQNGHIDAAALTMDEVLLLHQNDDDISVVLIMDISNGGDGIIAHPYISSMEQLKGKRVGVENNALGAYVMARALEISGLKKTDIIIVPASVDRHEEAFKSKEVDAVVTFDPVLGALIRHGGVKIFDSKEIPQEIIDVLIVRTSYLQSHTKQVQRLIDAWFSVLTKIKNGDKQSLQYLAGRLNLTNENLKESYKGLLLGTRDVNLELLQTNKQNLMTSIDKQLEVLIRNKLIEKPVDTRGLFSNTHLINHKLKSI